MIPPSKRTVVIQLLANFVEVGVDEIYQPRHLLKKMKPLHNENDEHQ